MAPDALFEIGMIVRAHGVRGELKIAPDMSDPYAFESFDQLYLGDAPATAQAVEVTSIRYQQAKKGLTVIAKLEGVDDRDAADALRKTRVFIPETMLPPLDDDEYFLHDLIGLAVFTDTDEPVGTIRDVLELPAQVTFIVARDGQPDVMIPDVPDIVQTLDFEAQRVVIRPIDGLLD